MNEAKQLMAPILKMRPEFKFYSRYNPLNKITAHSYLLQVTHLQ
jgi:hypothetical protein